MATALKLPPLRAAMTWPILSGIGLRGHWKRVPMAKRSKFDIRYSGPIIAVAAAFLIAWMWIRPDLNKSEPAPEIITQQEIMCKSYEFTNGSSA